MVCKLQRRQNPFPAKVPRARTALIVSREIEIPFGIGCYTDSWRSTRGREARRSASMFRRNYESILVFPGFSTGTESTRRRAVNAPLHPAKKEPQRVRHLAVLRTSVRKDRQ